MVKTINSNWHGTLEFLAGILSEGKAIKLIKEIYKSYSEAIGEYDTKYPLGKLTPGFDEFFEEIKFDECINKFNSVCKIAYETGLPSDKLPSSLREEICSSSVIEEYFWKLDGKAQTFVFQHLPSKDKKGLVDKVIEAPYWNEEEGLDYYPSHGFKFDLEGTELVIESLPYVSAEECLLPPPCLVEYLPRNKEVTDLWWDYFNSDQPYEIYAAEVLVEFGEVRILKPLWELLKKPTPVKGDEPYSTPHEYCWLEPMVRCLVKIGEPAVLYIEKEIRTSRGKEKAEGLDLARDIGIHCRFKGTAREWDFFLEKLLPITEEILREGSSWERSAAVNFLYDWVTVRNKKAEVLFDTLLSEEERERFFREYFGKSGKIENGRKK